MSLIYIGQLEFLKNSMLPNDKPHDKEFALIFLQEWSLGVLFIWRGKLYLTTKDTYVISLQRKYEVQILLLFITSFIITLTSFLHSEDRNIVPFNSQPVDINAVV